MPKSVLLSPLFKGKDLQDYFNKTLEWFYENHLSIEDIKLEYLKKLQLVLKHFDGHIYKAKILVSIFLLKIVILFLIFDNILFI